MGTFAYMAPEQARGLPLDARADLFSFGLVLREMATGMLPTAAMKLACVPPELERIIAKCLETDREMRYQHASEIRTDLIRLKRNSELSPVVAAAPSKRKWWIPSAAAALTAASIGVWFIARPVHAKLTDHDTIVVADFVNKTGDPAFDDTLRQGLVVQLQQSPFLSLISDQKIRATLKLMGKPADASLTGDAAREVCERVGARAVLTGSIKGFGTHYVMNLRADGCGSGDALDDQQVDVAGKEQVLKTLGDMAGRFRSRAGESLATVPQNAAARFERNAAGRAGSESASEGRGGSGETAGCEPAALFAALPSAAICTGHRGESPAGESRGAFGERAGSDGERPVAYVGRVVARGRMEPRRMGYRARIRRVIQGFSGYRWRTLVHRRQL